MSKRNNTISRKKLAACISAVLFFSASAGSQADIETISLDLKSDAAEATLMKLAQNAGVQILISQDADQKLKLPALTGEFTLASALEELLIDTGLAYEFTSDESVIITVREDDKKEAANDGEDDVDEEIVVTGSKLIVDPGKMTRQMTIIDRAELERSGVTRLDEYLQRLPQNINAPTNVGSGFAPNGATSHNFGLGPNVYAGSSVNLRGLGAQYTLILIDGRRPAGGGQFGAITDISNIPVDRVERIEILFDGAAAIYGADAIGGVVNIITNREYQGTNISLTYADTADGGGARTNFQVGHTFSWDTGSLTATVNYQSQEQIAAADRQNLRFADAVSRDLPTSLPGNISGPVDFLGRLTRPLMWVKDINGDGDTLDEELGERLSAGMNVDGVLTEEDWQTGEIVSRPVTFLFDRHSPRFIPGFVPNEPMPSIDDSDGFTAIYNAQLPEYNGQPLSLYDISDSNELGEDVYVPFDGLALSPKDETFDYGLTLNQELGEDLNLRMSVNYGVTDKLSNNKTSAEQQDVSVDAINNPFVTEFRYAWDAGFPQQAQSVHQTSYATSGDLTWGFMDNWVMEFGFGLSKTKNKATEINSIRPSYFYNFDGNFNYQPNLSDLIKGFYRDQDFEQIILPVHFNDPLLGYESQAALLSDLVDPFQNSYSNSYSRDMDFSLKGTLFTLPAGDVLTNIALGHRKSRTETYNENDAYFTSIFLGAGGAGGLDAETTYDDSFGQTTNSLAGEIAVPLIGSENSLPLVDGLLVNASVRYEDYSNTDRRGLNWAAGLNWSINDWMKVRLNRTYSLRVPESVRSARPVEYRRNETLDLFIDPNDPSTGIRVDRVNWTVSNGSLHLKSERNYGTALGLDFTPTFMDGLTIQLNITESNTYDKIGWPGVQDFRPQDIEPGRVALNPILDFADPGNNPVHAAVESKPDRFTGAIYTMAEGDLIIDRRAYNVGSNFNRGVDLQIRYDYDSDWGLWGLTWRHQYLIQNEVIQSDICDGDVCLYRHQGSRFDGQYGTAVDIVETVDRRGITTEYPLPEHTGFIDLSWDYRGFGVNLSTRYQTETTIIQSPDVRFVRNDDGEFIRLFNFYEETTKPAQSANMGIYYDFANGDLVDPPKWLDTLRISLTVDDVWSKERKVTSRWISKEFDLDNDELGPQEVNPYRIRPRGRAFSLNVRGSF